MSVEHNFLLTPSNWQITGYLLNAKEQQAELTGYINISHNKAWQVITNWQCSGEFSYQQQLSWDVKPLLSDSEITAYFSGCNNTNKLAYDGYYNLIGDTILCTYINTHKQIQGLEYIILLANGSYQGRGKLSKNNKFIYSWTFLLTADK